MNKINDRAMYEIGNLIGVLKKWNFKKLTPQEIMSSYEYEMFRRKNPALCEFAEGIKT